VKHAWIAAVVLSTLALVPDARAGARSTYQVYVARYADRSGWMAGTLGGTRNTGDSIVSFGCSYQNDHGSRYASCYGYDGVTGVGCVTTDPSLTDTISRLSGDSYLGVSFDASGNCTSVQIGASSQWSPKAP
jgi:hypothetical protein